MPVRSASATVQRSQGTGMLSHNESVPYTRRPMPSRQQRPTRAVNPPLFAQATRSAQKKVVTPHPTTTTTRPAIRTAPSADAQVRSSSATARAVPSSPRLSSPSVTPISGTPRGTHQPQQVFRDPTPRAVFEPEVQPTTDMIGVERSFGARPTRPMRTKETIAVDIFGNPVKQRPPPPCEPKAVAAPVEVKKRGGVPWTTNTPVSELLAHGGSGVAHDYHPMGMETVANRMNRGRPKGTMPIEKLVPPYAQQQQNHYGGHSPNVSTCVQAGDGDVVGMSMMADVATQLRPSTPNLEARHTSSSFEAVRKRVLQLGGRWGVRPMRAALDSVDQDRDGRVDKAEFIVALQRANAMIALADVNAAYRHMVSEEPRPRNQPPFREGTVGIAFIMENLQLPINSWSDARDKVVQEAYHFIDRKLVAKARLAIPDLCRVVKVNDFPTVRAGLETAHRALQQFAVLFMKNQRDHITIDDFRCFYQDVSPGVPVESDFVDMVTRLWGLAAEREKKQREAAELATPMPEGPEMVKLFHRIDDNHNGYLSLAELDKAVVMLWPQLNNKPAIIRAYKLVDSDRNGWLTIDEFPRFLHYVVVYNRLWKKFEKIDKDGDRRVTYQELKQGAKHLGLGDVPERELREIFASIDTNGGGCILFEEFCLYMAKRLGDEAMAMKTNQF